MQYCLVGFQFQFRASFLFKIIFKFAEHFYYQATDRTVSGTNNHYYLDMVKKSPEWPSILIILTESKCSLSHQHCGAILNVST